MRRRTFLGAVSTGLAGLAGCTSAADDGNGNQPTTTTTTNFTTTSEMLTTTETSDEPPTTTDDRCYNEDQSTYYTCDNSDQNAEFDTYYFKAWIDDPSNEIVEVDYSEDVVADYSFRSTDYELGVLGHVRNLTETTIGTLEITSTTYEFDESKDRDDWEIVARGQDSVYDASPDTTYPFNATSTSDYDGELSMFSLTITGSV